MWKTADSIAMPMAAVAACGLWIGLGGCGAYRQAEQVDSQRMQAVVADVMQDSSAAGPKEDPLKILDRYQGGLLEGSGERTEPKARALHQWADLLLTLEERAYRQQLQRYNQKLRSMQEEEALQRLAPPRIDHGRSQKLYERLLALYPDRSENDRVRYQLARIYDDLGQIDQAMAVLQQLADRHPSSPLVQEALFRLAEAYYDSNQYRQAKSVYQRVLNLPGVPSPELAEMALYKLGWAYLELQDYENAITVFIRLVDSKRVVPENRPPVLDPGALSAAEWDQVLEVIRGLAIAFSYFGPPAKIHDYFERKGHRDYEDLVYRKLGDLFMAQKRVQDAVGVYEAFIRTYPLHPEAPFVQTDIIEAFQRLRLVDPANRARIQFVDRFGPDSPWYQKAPADGREKVRPIAQKLVSQLALFYHSEAQKTRRPQDYEKAIGWYRRYLKAFPKEPDAARVRFLLAEGLYELGRYPDAVEEYDQAAYGYPLHADSAEAGYAAILTLEKLAAQGREDPKTGSVAMKMAQDCKRFAEAFPDDPRLMDVLWKGAETYYRAGKRAEARSMAEAVVRVTLPTDEASHKAQRLIATSYLEGGAYEEAAAAYRRLVRTGGRLSDEEKLKRSWAAALYKKGEAYRNAGKLREAQTEFMRVHAEVPGSDAAPVALFDAGSVALLRDKIDEALQLFQIQLQRYPDHLLSQKVPETLLQVERKLLTAGQVTEAQALTDKMKALQTASRTDLAYRAQRLIADRYFEQRAYGSAAFIYRALAQDEVSARNRERDELRRLLASALYKHAESLKAAGKAAEAQAAFLKVQAEAPENEVAPAALFEAGSTAVDRGDADGAIAAFSLLMREYPTSTYTVHAAIQTAEIDEQEGRLAEAAQRYEFVINLDPDRKTAGAALQAAARLYEQAGDWDKAAEAYKVYLERFPGEYETVVENTYKMASAHLQRGRRSEAQSILQHLIDRYGKAEAAVSSAGYYIAKAYLFKADDRMFQFDAVKLVSPLEQNLARKKKLLNELLDEYARVIDFQLSELTTEAAHKIGAAFEKFRTALLESERPTDLTPQQLEQYNFLLEEQAYPFEEKAIAAYESNVQRAQKLGVYDSWIQQSYQDLARLLPARYRKPELDEVIHWELISGS